MATAAVELPNSNRVVPGSHLLASVSWPKGSDTQSIDAENIAAAWTSSLNGVIQNKEFDVSGLFLGQSFWRDLLCLTWDFHTLQGPEKIASFVKDQAKGWRIKSIDIDHSSEVRKPAVAPVDFGGNVKGVQSFLTVESDVGKGRGLVRLLQDPEDGGKWKAFTLFTTLEELNGHEATVKARRPTGVEHGTQPNRKNWKERRDTEESFGGDLEPSVLIIGEYVLR